MLDGIVRVAVFPPNTIRDIVLQSNGKVLDSICTMLEGEEDLAGNFIVEANFINDKNLVEFIKKGSILKVRNEFGEDEIFRITTLESGTMLINIIAFQITITDTQTLWLKDTRPTNTNGQGALTSLYNAADSFGFPKEIFVDSDITIQSTAYYMNMTLYNALYNCDQSFINRWGGETLRRQYNLSINSRIGQDRGHCIREGKNLTGFKATVNFDGLVTVAIGKGYEGIEGHYIESPLKNKYPRAYIKEIEYSDVKVRKPSDNDSEGFNTLDDAIKELDKRIKEEFFKNHIDEIKATYDINFIQLAQTEEYKEYSYLERFDIGDTVRVKVNSLDIELTTRIINKKVDYLSARVLEMKLSNNPVTIENSDSKILSDIRNTLIKNNNSSLANYVDAKLKAGLKGSYTIARDNEFLAMDTQDIRTAKVVARLNKNGLGFSTTGYNGKYTYGFTLDGKINASLIQTGVLRAIQIESDGGKSYWNLDNGDFCLNGGRIIGKNGNFEMNLQKEGELSFKNNGKEAIKIHNNSIDLFNWSNDSDYIGSLMSLCKIINGKSDPEKPLIGLTHDNNSSISLGYQKDDGTYNSYIEFDKYNILGHAAKAPMKVFEHIEMNDNIIYNPKLKADNALQIYINGGLIATFGEKGLWLNVPIFNKDGNLAFDPMAPQGETVDGSDELRNKVVNSARKLIGKWYVYGGNYPPLGKDSGTDCSGLMQWAYNDNGIKISRTTYTQIKEGSEVSEGNLKPGDLVFPSDHHVFMYSGESNGRHMCVEAAHTGTQLRERAFSWGSGYRARRIIKENSSGGGGSVGGSAVSKASANIIYYVKGIEGFGPNYYYDDVGVRTLGYGMTGGELNGVSTPLSEASATHYLTKFFNRDYYESVLRIVKSKGVKNPKQREIDAFASFAYNLGVPAFSDSTLLKKYVAGERGEAIHEQFKRWVHAGGKVYEGLVRRREEEWKIFSNSAHVAGYNGRPYIDIIGPQKGTVTANGGYGAAPY
ncbi:NlpC/P60 family protein [Clostridium sp. LY3-2]|uniref:phage tail spike protein n=1 Tax=Clostridium sp. LY3-2 TaxID=2942482 RepID=UPI0021526432|nr:phage tail spike protein [Clostridium sp. LY3-2]MCR6516332.1 NlpC/P60 family protein [Clostridium sp. LY3-2]